MAHNRMVLSNPYARLLLTPVSAAMRRGLCPFSRRIFLELFDSTFWCFPPLLRRDRKLNQMGGDVIGPWSASGAGGVAGPPPETESETMSNAQRSTLKWEKEETLGEMATVAPVLYTNVNFPALREQYPGEGVWVDTYTRGRDTIILVPTHKHTKTHTHSVS